MGAFVAYNSQDENWLKQRLVFAEEAPKENEKVIEETNETKEIDETKKNEDHESDMEMLFLSMTPENATELFNNKRDKLFYFYRGNKDERIEVLQWSSTMQQSGFNV